jgi:AcrR family transcriptional regulator
MVPPSPVTEDPPKPRRGRPPRVSRDEILNVATELFARRGFRATTLAAIAAEIGATDASILHYFDSKREILDAVLDKEDERGRTEFLEMMGSGGLDGLRRLPQWGELMEQNPVTTSLILVLSAEALSENSELHGQFEQRYRYIRSRIAKTIRQGIERGEIDADVDALHEATALVAFIDGIRLQWFLSDGKVSISEHYQHYMDHLISRIVPAPGRRRGASR